MVSRSQRNGHLRPRECPSPRSAPPGSQYLVGDERQPHALQLAPRLAEDEVVLLGLGDDEVQPDLRPQRGVGEGEGVQRGLIELRCGGKGQSLSAEPTATARKNLGPSRA